VSVAYYFDAPVNRAIAVGLRLREVEVLTAQEDGQSRTEDEQIMTIATNLNRPVVTTDRDFLILAKERLDRGEQFSGVFFLSSQISIGYAVEELEIYAKAGETEDFLNRVIFL
jgi:predicted nuclease of predicted toxin-antitoxin system